MYSPFLFSFIVLEKYFCHRAQAFYGEEKACDSGAVCCIYKFSFQTECYNKSLPCCRTRTNTHSLKPCLRVFFLSLHSPSSSKKCVPSQCYLLCYNKIHTLKAPQGKSSRAKNKNLNTNHFLTNLQSPNHHELLHGL